MKTEVGTCPWCGETVEPIATALHLDEASFQYGNKNDPRHVDRNPAMCPECTGVGGWEDFLGEQ